MAQNPEYPGFCPKLAGEQHATNIINQAKQGWTASPYEKLYFTAQTTWHI